MFIQIYNYSKLVTRLKSFQFFVMKSFSAIFRSQRKRSFFIDLTQLTRLLHLKHILCLARSKFDLKRTFFFSFFLWNTKFRGILNQLLQSNIYIYRSYPHDSPQLTSNYKGRSITSEAFDRNTISPNTRNLNPTTWPKFY